MQTTAPRPFVFVLMPFAPDFDDIYKIGIKETSEKIGFHCERVDEQIYEGTILDRIYNQISKADVIVADMTGRNPNVFYEAGYAHALGKTVILLTRQADDIPFDLRHFPHVIYAGRIQTLRDELGKRLQWVLDNPQGSLAKADLPVEVFLNGVPIDQAAPRSGPAGMSFAVSLKNVGRSSLSATDLSIAVVAPSHVVWRDGSPPNSIMLPEGLFQYDLPDIPRIFPEGWTTVGFALRDERRMSFAFSLRIYSELGCKEYGVPVSITTI